MEHSKTKSRHKTSFEVGFNSQTTFQFAPSRAGEIGVRSTCTADIGTADIGTADIGTADIGTADIGTSNTDTSDIGITGAGEIEGLEVGAGRG